MNKLDKYQILKYVKLQEINRDKEYVCIVGNEEHEPTVDMMTNLLEVFRECDYNIRLIMPYYSVLGEFK